MPQLPSGKKHVRADAKKHVLNHAVKSNLRNSMREIRELVKSGQSDEAKQKLVKVHSKLDKAAKRNIIHPGNAKRKKSRLATLVNK